MWYSVKGRRSNLHYSSEDDKGLLPAVETPDIEHAQSH